MANTFPAMNDVTEHYSNPANGSERRWPARAFSRTVRAVCGACNSGWMSEIEAQAKPLLERMFTGRTVKLGPKRQTILATWAVGKALIHTHAEVKPNPIPRSHYEQFYARKRPPDETVVWLGAHVPRVLDHERQLVLEGRSQPIQPLPGSDAEVVEGFERGGKAYGWTLSYGIAAFQMFGSDFLDMGGLEPSRGARPALRRIWPVTRRTTWPPPVRLTTAIGDLPQLPRAFLSQIDEADRDEGAAPNRS